MHPLIEQIGKISIFKDLTIRELEEFFNESRYRIEEYDKDDIIRFGGEKLQELLLLLNGEVKAEINDFNGKVIQIERLKAPSILALGFLYAKDANLPVDVVACGKVTIMVIQKEILIEWAMKDKKVLEGILEDIGSRLNFLSQKIKLSTMKTLKEKVAFYLMQLSKQQGNKNEIMLPVTIEELSQLFGVARPSLSRVMIEMEEAGLIKKEGNKVIFLDKETLSDFNEI